MVTRSPVLVALPLTALLLSLAAAACGGRVVAPDPNGDGAGKPGNNTSVGPRRTFTSSTAPPPAVKPNETVFVPAIPGQPAPGRPTPDLDCAYAGKIAGESACCVGDLCVGECDASRACSCGGHPWCEFPAVCCGRACTGPDDPRCRAPEDRTKAPLPIEVIEEGDCGGAVNRSNGGVLQACCGGVLCKGRCVKNGADDTPHCECFGIRGGAPDGMECCATQGYVRKTQCDW